MEYTLTEQFAKLGRILWSMAPGNVLLLVYIALWVFSVLRGLNTYMQGRRSCTVFSMLQMVGRAKGKLRQLLSE